MQVTGDGLRSYIEAMEAGFGAEVDYAQLIKLYGETPHPAGRYSPAQIQGTITFCCTGRPDPHHISTSYVERQNLTMRMSMRRFTRLTNGFSKKAENHAHSVAIHFMHYNFVRIHQSLRITPAMAAGVTQTLWSLTDMVRVIEDWEAVRATKVSGETLVRKARDATLVHSGFSSGAFPGWRVARSIRRAAPSGQNLTLGAGGWADDDPSQTGRHQQLDSDPASVRNWAFRATRVNRRGWESIHRSGLPVPGRP